MSSNSGGPPANTVRVHRLAFVKVKQDASQEQIEKVISAMKACKDQIPGIVSVDFAPLCTPPDALSKGFTHGLQISFADKAAFDVYIPHPLHQAMGGQMMPIVDGGLKGIVVVNIEDTPIEYGDVGIHRIAVFKFKADSSQEKVHEAISKMKALKDQIPGILSTAFAPLCTPPDATSKGFTHGLHTCFADKTALNEYLPHPLHQGMGGPMSAVLDGGLDGVTVVNFPARPRNQDSRL